MRAALVIPIAITACSGPARQAPAVSDPVSGTLTDPANEPLEVEPPAQDAGAAPVEPPAIDAGTASAAASKKLVPTKVSWPKDRRPAQFHLLGGDTAASNALVVSADGSTPIGMASADAETTGSVRWRNGTMNPLASAWPSPLPVATSRNGDVVAARVDLDGDESRPLAIVWRGDGDAVALPALPDGMPSAKVRAVSRDGSVIVGCVGEDCGTLVRWSKHKAVLVEAPEKLWLGKHPMSEDGAVLAGYIAAPGPTFEGIRVGPGRDEPRFGAGSVIEGISDDGRVVVGSVDGKAMLWRGTTPTELGRLAGFDRCKAVAVSADGGRVVGNCVDMDKSPVALDREIGFVWDKKNGLRSVPDALRAAGVSLPDGILLQNANDICGYGLTLVGHARHATGRSEAWMAILPR